MYNNMGTYNKAKHRQIMVHASTKERLRSMFQRLNVKTYNAALEVLIGTLDAPVKASRRSGHI